MIIKANTELGMSCNILDLDTDELLEFLTEVDSDAGTVTRELFYVDGKLRVLEPRIERRRFRVVDALDGHEICRTGLAAFDVLKAMVG
jgi:hypothetical protein